jgi:glycosyltransferase involved in cell wall biosynthesis
MRKRINELRYPLREAIYIVLNDPFGLGGVQRVVSVLARGFRDSGRRVFVVGVRSSEPLAGFTKAENESFIFPFPRLPLLTPLQTRLFSRGMKFERIWMLGRRTFTRRFEKLVHSDPGHVIAMDVFAAELIANITMPQGCSRVVQFHNSFAAIDGTRDLARLIRISPRMNLLLALSEVDAECFRSQVACETKYLPNPLPFPSTPASLNRPDTVVCIGRLVPHKGTALLVDAWASLEAVHRAEWHLVLIGDGPESTALYRKIKEHRLEDSVTLAGPRQDIQGELMMARIMVLASEYEGLPMVLIEAMSQSVACIATDSSPGVRQLLASGAGTLVPVGSKDKLANALRDFMSSPSKVSAAAQIGYMESKKYELSAIILQWETVLQNPQGVN